MNEEEKKAIANLIDSSNISLIGDGTCIISNETIATILNLIEKQQRETEILKAIINKEHENNLDKRYVELKYISKDKIREKIKELEEEGNYRSKDNHSGRVHFHKEDTDYKIEVLKELLEE